MPPLQVLISVEQKDYLGVTTTHDLFMSVPDTTTLAQLNTLVDGYQVVYDPITGGKIEKVTTRVFNTLDVGNKATPVAGDENEKTGLFNFSQSGSTYKYGVDVPAIIETAIVDGKIDLSNASIAAWITWLTSAHSGALAVSKFFMALTALLDALITFRKHRKAENRRSIVTP